MAISERIKFRNTDDSNEYEVPINPHEIDPKDSDDYTLIKTLDGGPIKSSSNFDDRERSLTWPFHEVSNSTFMAMVSELKSYNGVNKKIYLGDIDTAYSFSWRNIKVIDVTTTMQRGGKLRQSMELIYVYTSAY